MIKHFCDACTREVTRNNQFEHKEVKVGAHVVELTVKEPFGDKDALCLHCVIAQIQKLSANGGDK